MFNNVNAQLMFQYSTAYFNPYEVKHRKRTSRAQLTVLEATFQENNKPSSHVKKALAAQLDMPIRNVQVWFQNRRAKDKNLALKRAKAQPAGDGEADEADPDHDGDPDGDCEGGNGEGSRTGSEADTAADSHSPNPDKDNQQTPVTESDPASISLLAPPSNLPLRRESVPNIAFSPSASITSAQARSFVSPSARTTSESRAPLIPPQPLQIPSASLGRRQSLPAFHPNAPRPIQAVPALPSLALDSNSPVADHGHGGVYRSPSISRLNAAAAIAPYPARAGPSNTAHRTGSTPGTSVFRVPANPLPSASGTWIDLNAKSDAPFTFPPRPYADLPNTGPLPAKDFRFGDSSINTNTSLPQPHPSHNPPSQNTNDEEDRFRNIAQAQSHRFGSFTSELSVESDATGTTATTTTSSNGFSPLTNPPLSGGLGSGTSHPYRTRYPVGLGIGYGNGPHQSIFPQHANTADSGLGASISYGMGASSGSIAGLSAGSVQFPAKFDPESRRASCPAHFVENMAHLNVTQPSMAPADRDGSAPFPIRQSINFNRNPSGNYGLGKSPLGMRLSGYPQHPANPPAHHETVNEVDEPLTAVGGYSMMLNGTSTNFDYTPQGGGPQTINTGGAQQTPGDYSQQRSSTSPLAAQSPYTAFSGGSSRTNSTDPNPADHTAPVFTNTFTQEPMYDSMSFPYGSHPTLSAPSASYGSIPNEFPHARTFSLSYGSEPYTAPIPLNYQPPDNSGGYNRFEQHQQHQEDNSQPIPPSFNSFLHAPAPVTPSSASSLAGALSIVPSRSGDGNDPSVGWS